MDSSNFKDRFSLDYLSPDSNSFAEQLAARYASYKVPQGIEAVLDLLGAQLLLSLKAVPTRTSTLLDLAKATSLRLEALLPVVQYLSSRGFIELVSEDPSGNDTYRVTPVGETAKL